MVTVQFTDGANLETLVKPIPIVLKKLDVEFFPEGGDLVARPAKPCLFPGAQHARQTRRFAGKLA